MDSNHRVTGYEPVILPTEVNPHLFRKLSANHDGFTRLIQEGCTLPTRLTGQELSE